MNASGTRHSSCRPACRPALLLLAVVLAAFAPGRASAQDTPPYDHPLFTGPVQALTDHPFDQEKVRLRLDLFPDDARIEATMTLRVRPLDVTDRLVLFAHDLTVDSLALGPPGGPYHPTPFRSGAADSLVIPLDSLGTPPGSTGIQPPFEVRMRYHGHPQRGLTFLPSSDGAAPVVFSINKPDYARYWLPVFDAPLDKLTAETFLTVPATMTAATGGVYIDQQEAPGGRTTYHFIQRAPVSPHEISLVAGPFDHQEQAIRVPDGRTVNVTLLFPHDRADAVARTFAPLGDILRFFVDKLGTPFPWPALTIAVTPDLPFPAFANAGLVYVRASELLDARAAHYVHPANLLAHELAHQWFGGVTTAEYWYDAWLDEALATYTARRYTAGTEGADALQAHLQTLANTYEDEARRYRRPLVWDRWERPEEMFDAHGQARGAWVLHMIHEQIGDQHFWRVLQSYLRRFRDDVAITSDFRETLENVTRQSFVDFFDQWVYGAGHPVIEAGYRYDLDAESLSVTVAQTQTGYLVPEVFTLPLTIEVLSLAGMQSFDVVMDQREQTFTFPMRLAPRYVALDPQQAVLAQIDVTQPATAWVAQLRGGSTTSVRVAAARALHRFASDPALLIGLRGALEAETEASVRAAIVDAMGALPPSEAARRAVLEATEDDDARVRVAAFRALRSYDGDAAVASRALRAAGNDDSYDVQAAAVRTLAAIHAPDAETVVRSALITPSHHEVIRVAGLSSLADLDLNEREHRTLLLDYAGPGHALTVRAAAARLLAPLASSNRQVRRRLDALAADPHPTLQAAACAALRGSDVTPPEDACANVSTFLFLR